MDPFTTIVLVSTVIWIAGICVLMYKVDQDTPRRKQHDGHAGDPWRAPWTSSAMQDSMDGGE